MDLRQRRRGDYLFFRTYRTRWSDNDQESGYSHLNNSVYAHYFDSIVNDFLISECGLQPASSPLIGLVISSWCQFFSPVSFPQVLELGLRVNKLGNSSVSYEVGVFTEGEEPAVVGGYTHVFVDREERKSRAIASETRKGLSSLIRSGAAKL